MSSDGRSRASSSSAQFFRDVLRDPRGDRPGPLLDLGEDARRTLAFHQGPTFVEQQRGALVKQCPRRVPPRHEVAHQVKHLEREPSGALFVLRSDWKLRQRNAKWTDNGGHHLYRRPDQQLQLLVALVRMGEESGEELQDELAVEWLERLREVRGAKPSTIGDYGFLLREPGMPYRRGSRVGAGRMMAAFGDRAASDVTTAEVSKFLRALDREGPTSRNVNKHRQVLAAIFTYGCRDDTHGYRSIRSPGPTNAARIRRPHSTIPR